MEREIIYMLGVIAVGFAVNYALRALPFLLFAGKSRELPRWVERFGNLISPVIIAALVVYSYSGLEWKTAWPYLAGALTVGLQLWRRNALASIVAGTVAYMLLLNVGCVSLPEVGVDANDPSVMVKGDGVYFDETRVEMAEVAPILERAEIPHTRTIHILLDEGVTDLRPARMLMGSLARAGYTRPVLVTKRHAESSTISAEEAARRRAARQSPVRAPQTKKIRYKGANE